MKFLRWSVALVIFVGLTTIARAETPVSGRPVLLERVTASRALSDGVEVTSGVAIMRITAITDDIIRIRVAVNGTLPEDASWAIRSEAHGQTVKVGTENSGEGSLGFHTRSMRVFVDRETMCVRVTDLAGNLIQEDAPGRPIEFHGDVFRVHKTMPGDEHYFGLGDKAGPLDRRGEAFSMWNTDYYAWQESGDPLYKDIPFFMTFRQGRAAGVFLDNTFRSSFDFGREAPTTYSFGSEGGPLDYYVINGPGPKKVMDGYAWLTGYTPLPPMWSLGYQQSRSSYYPESQVRDVANHLRRDRIPADVIYLDIDYQEKFRPFTVDTKLFPHFGELIGDLKHQDLRVVAITDLHIADTPDKNYAPYDSGVSGDHFVKKPDGSVYVGEVWPGASVFPEFTRASSRAWWGSLYTDFVHAGVAGFWNDMNEPAIFNSSKTMPDDVQHRIEEPGFARRTADHREIHNVYGMENSRATYEGLLKLSPKERPFVLTRASYSGGQRYATTWTGDNTSTWNHLRLSTPTLLNLGLSGFAMCGADVGGFSGTPQPNLLTKWFELGAFQPFFRDHTARNTGAQEPWANGQQHEDIRRTYIETRYKLMPYLYTTAEEMARTGVPIMRPLFMEFPSAAKDKHPIDLDAGAEFLFGPDLLVAPAPFPEELDAYSIKFPPGNWYDFWTGKKLSQADTKSGDEAQAKPISVTPELAVLPVYVRGGSIVPMQPLTQSTMEIPKGPLTLRVYPGDHCHGSVYADDGVSFGFKKGEFARESFTCEATPHGVVIHVGRREGSYAVWWKTLRIEVYGADVAARAVRINSAIAADISGFDSASHSVSVNVADDGREKDIALEWR